MTRWKEYEVTSGPLQHLSKIQEFQEVGKTGVVKRWDHTANKVRGSNE